MGTDVDTKQLFEKGIFPPPLYLAEEPYEEGEQLPPNVSRIKVSPQGELLKNYITYKGFVSDVIAASNDFIERKIPLFVGTTIIPLPDGTVATFGPIAFDLPHYIKNGEKKPLTPHMARLNDLTYRFDIYGHVSIRSAPTNPDDPCSGAIIEQTNSPVYLGSIPSMLGSSGCYLAGKTDSELIELGEDFRDPFSYFIINGNEKVILFQEMLRVNRYFIYSPSSDPDNVMCTITIDTPRGTVITQLKLGPPAKDSSLARAEKEIGNSKHFSIIEMRLSGLQKNLTGAFRTANVFNVIRLFSQVYPDELSWANNFDIIVILIGYFVKKENVNIVINELTSTIVDAAANGDDLRLLARVMSIEEYPHLQQIEYIKNYFERSLFPNVKSPTIKVFSLAMMTAMLGEYAAGIRPIDNRNDWMNKRGVHGARMVEQLFRGLWKRMTDAIRKGIAVPTAHGLESVLRLLKPNIITDGFQDSFAGVNWGVNAINMKKNVVHPLLRGSIIDLYSMVTRFNVEADRKTKDKNLRSLHPSQWGYICPAETPENEACGLIEARAVTARTTIDRSSEHVVQILKGVIGGKKWLQGKPSQDANGKVLVNGAFHGWCEAEATRAALRKHRLEGSINRETCIVLDEDDYLHIHTDAGRLVRPLLVVNDDGVPVIQEKKLWGRPFGVLFENGAVEYIDAFEQHYIKIAAILDSLTSWRDSIVDIDEEIHSAEINLTRLKNGGLEQRFDTDLLDENTLLKSIQDNTAKLIDLRGKKYTHAELHPQALFGNSVSIMPFPEFNQAPRVTYQSQMGRQALGTYHTNHLGRFDGKTKVLSFPTRPLIQTQAEELFGMDILPQGKNLIVAIETLSGLNQEDAFVIDQRAIDFGKLNIHKYFDVIEDIKNTADIQEELIRPQPRTGESADRYRFLTAQGLPAIGAYLKQGDYVIGKIRRTKETGEVKNVSRPLRIGEEGIVTKIRVIGDEKTMRVKVKLRLFKKSEVGDKFSSRYAQKGTIGTIRDHASMPFIESGPNAGMVPDMMVNPHSVPKRMTMGYILEALVGTAAAITGERFNATAFEKFDIDKFYGILRDYGLDPHGYYWMRDGVSGRRFKAMVYMGPIFIQALRHHAAEKIQVRSEGPVKMLTRQPPRGAVHNGGLRFGEMERNAVLSHGAAHFLDERLCKMSDAYTNVFCVNCGTFATLNAETRAKVCVNCKNDAQFGKVTIPYAYKLLTHYLGGLGFFLRFDLTKIRDVDDLVKTEEEELDIEGLEEGEKEELITEEYIEEEVEGDVFIAGDFIEED